MKINKVILALLLAVPLSMGHAIAGSTKSLSLMDAVKQDDREAVRSALKDLANGDLSGAQSAAALIWAVTGNDAEVLDLLLRAGADVNAANEYGATALYAAAASADSGMTEKLLAAGADPNAHLLSGETALMQAARRGNLATVRALLSGRADANALEGNGGQNALMWAISERHSGVAEELVRRGADVGARSKRGFTALMFAAQQGDLESARLLLHAGANPNDVMPPLYRAPANGGGEGRGLTALLIASAMARTQVATLLLENGADPNIVDGQGFTALHRAAQNKAAVAIVRALLSHRANPNIRLVQEKPTILISGVSVLGATPLVLAAEINNYDAVVALADGGADPLIPTEQKTTALILAAGGGTDVSRPRPAEERATAVRTVKFLVERGSDVNAAGQFGWTALHAAAYQGLNDVVAYLAGKGANLDAMDEFGQTPLSIANAIVTKGLGAAYYQTARTFHRDTAELLLKLGATPLDRSGVVAVNRRAE